MGGGVVCYLLSGHFISAQITPDRGSTSTGSFSYEVWSIDTVTFHKPLQEPMKWIRIHEDPVANPTTVIDPLVYLSGNDSTTVHPSIADYNVPVAYVSGCKPVISSRLSSDCVGSPNIWVKAKAAFGETNWVNSTYNAATQKYETGQIEFTTQLTPDEVRAYEDVDIDWYINRSNTGEGRYIASNRLDLYVTHDQPDVSNVLRSFLHISCNAADGESIEESIFQKVWSDFTDRSVTKYGSSEAMYYWGGNIPAQINTSLCFTGEALIAHNDATCGAWADLLVKLLNCQGLEDAGFVQAVKPTNQQANTLLLKPASDTRFKQEVANTFGPTPGPDSTSYQLSARAFLFVKHYQNDLENTIFSMNKDVGLTPTSLIVNNGNGVADTLYNGRLLGLPAQGDQNDNPVSIFENHAVVVRNGLLHDPSYGTGPFSDFNDYYSSSLEGEGSRMQYFYKDVLNNPMIEEIIWIEATY